MIRLFLILNVAFSSAHVINQRLKLSLNGTHRLPSSDSYNLGSNEKLYFGQKVDFFDQKLDHLDANSQETWKQRYWHDDSHFQANGRVLLFVHGVYTANEPNMEYINNKFLIPLAENLKATRFYLEHRFYGESKPKSDTSPESLVYLNSKQALADIAYFIEKIPEKHPYLKDIKWVVIGVSYGGTLATWARFKYQTSILSAIAIDAPLLAKADYGEYYENVAESLNKCNSKCVERITQANQELENAIKNESGRKEVFQKFQLCNELTEDSDDVSSLFAELAENFAHAVDFSGMRNLSPKPSVSLSELCNIMSKPDTPVLDAYAEVNKVVMKALYPEQKCLDHRYKNRIELLKNTNYGDPTKISRQWIYQTCTEFGFLQSSSKTSGIFGNHFPATFLAKRCQELFKPDFSLANIEAKVSSVNQEFKGLEIDVSNVIFVYHSEDPWRNLFITNNKPGFYDKYKLETSSCPTKPDRVNQYGGFWNNSSSFVTFVEKKLGCLFSGGGGQCF